MTQRTLATSLIVWFCFFLLLALPRSPSAGQVSGGSNLLQNPGFEEGTEDWHVDHETTQFNTVTEPVHSGQWAASLNRTDGFGGEIYISQDVEGIVGGVSYALSGWATCNSNFRWVKLRIDWRNASGSVGLWVDSDPLTGDEEYQLLTIPKEGEGEGVRAPPDATIARIECMACIQNPNPATPVFFDDLSFTFQGLNWKVYLPLVVKNY